MSQKYLLLIWCVRVFALVLVFDSWKYNEWVDLLSLHYSLITPSDDGLIHLPHGDALECLSFEPLFPRIHINYLNYFNFLSDNCSGWKHSMLGSVWMGWFASIDFLFFEISISCSTICKGNHTKYHSSRIISPTYAFDKTTMSREKLLVRV